MKFTKEVTYTALRCVIQWTDSHVIPPLLLEIAKNSKELFDLDIDMRIEITPSEERLIVSGWSRYEYPIRHEMQLGDYLVVDGDYIEYFDALKHVKADKIEKLMKGWEPLTEPDDCGTMNS